MYYKEETMAQISEQASNEDINYIIRIIRYLLNPAIEKEAIEKLIYNFETKGVIEVKNVLERIMEQEKREGMREGKKEGLQEGKRQFVLNMTLQGLTAEVISKYTGISIKEIKKIQREGEM